MDSFVLLALVAELAARLLWCDWGAVNGVERASVVGFAFVSLAIVSALSVLVLLLFLLLLLALGAAGCCISVPCSAWGMAGPHLPQCAIACAPMASCAAWSLAPTGRRRRMCITAFVRRLVGMPSGSGGCSGLVRRRRRTPALCSVIAVM